MSPTEHRDDVEHGRLLERVETLAESVERLLAIVENNRDRLVKLETRRITMGEVIVTLIAIAGLVVGVLNAVKR